MKSTDPLEEIRADCCEPALLARRPQRIDSSKWIAAEQRERAFETRELLVSRRRLCVAAEAIELVEIDLQLVAVERIRVAVAAEGVAKEFSRLAHGLIEAGSAAAWIVAWGSVRLRV
jgi:hypothetical protein